MFENLIAALKADKRKIVFTEGPDARILEAAARLKKDGLMDSILVGNVDEVKAAAAKGGFDIEGMEIIDPATYPEMDAMVAKMVELRKGKMSEEDCRAALSKGNYFGTMLVAQLHRHAVLHDFEPKPLVKRSVFALLGHDFDIFAVIEQTHETDQPVAVPCGVPSPLPLVKILQLCSPRSARSV